MNICLMVTGPLVVVILVNSYRTKLVVYPGAYIQLIVESDVFK